MTAEQYLSQLKWLDKEIQSKEMELEDLRTKAENCSAKEITGMPGNGGNPDKLSEAVIRMVEMQNRISERKNIYIRLRQKISDMIDNMPEPEYRTILRDRYITGGKWTKIAKDNNMEERTAYRKRLKGLSMFEHIYPEILSLNVSDMLK